MGRYRTIKPEFWADDNMLDLSDSCAMFYVSLWNFCDDEGKIENKPRAISKQVCRWGQDKVKLFIEKLVGCGRLRISSDSAWLQVDNWSHQKIDRPKEPKVLASQIQWVIKNNSTTPPRAIDDHSAQVRESRVKEGKVEESEGNAHAKDDEFSYQFVEKKSSDNVPRGVDLKLEIFEEMFNDERWVTDIQSQFPKQNLRSAFDECWQYHSVKPSPPEHLWQWKQKMSTWLNVADRKHEGNSKTGNRNTDHIGGLAQDFATRNS